MPADAAAQICEALWQGVVGCLLKAVPFANMLPCLPILSAASWSLLRTMIGRLLAKGRSVRIFNMVMAVLLVAYIATSALT